MWCIAYRIEDELIRVVGHPEFVDEASAWLAIFKIARGGPEERLWIAAKTKDTISLTAGQPDA
jgi:hypothetical protein